MVETISNSVFERIHHSVNVFNSLQNCRDTLVMNREEIDGRLFEELNSFEAFMKRFESAFLQILMEDLQAISRAAVINTENSEKAEEMIGNIEALIGNFSKMESDCIARSESLIRMANKFKNGLLIIKKNMEHRIKSQKKHNKSLSSAIIGFPHANAN